MSRLRGWIGVSVIASTLCAYAAWYLSNWWTSPLPVGETAKVVVRKGETVGDLAGRLAESGLLDRPRLFRWMTRISGRAESLQAGEYIVKSGDTPKRLIERIVSGDVIHYRFRIVEGTRIADVLDSLRAEPEIGQTLGNVQPETLMAALGIESQVGSSHGEGWFFPDTYQFVAGDEDRALLMRAHLKMRAELEVAWAARDADLPYKVPYEVLIVASIVEKETGRADDRPHVSQVIAARIRSNMRLQVDPTVIYGIGTAFDGNLTRAHLRQVTPYNTYVHKGLPPTPIGLPGRHALQAAVQPSGAPYLYFVSRGDGSSQFSSTLEEHLAAVDKYQLKAQ